MLRGVVLLLFHTLPQAKGVPAPLAPGSHPALPLGDAQLAAACCRRLCKCLQWHGRNAYNVQWNAATQLVHQGKSAYRSPAKHHPVPTQPSPAWHSPAQPSPTQHSQAQHRPCQPSPFQPSTIQPSSAHPSRARPRPAHLSSSHPSPAHPSSSQPITSCSKQLTQGGPHTTCYPA